MSQYTRGPSRGVKAVARWALTSGVAGTAVAVPTIYSLLQQSALTPAPRGKLTLSAILLSLAFLLVPFVRRTFGGPDSDVGGRRNGSPRTLLDEMRNAPVGDDASRNAVVSATEPIPQAPDDATRRALVLRLVIAAYVVFALALLLILWGMRRL